MKIALFLKYCNHRNQNQSDMNKQSVLIVVGLLALVASVAMYVIGGNSSHLTELKQFWWIPLPIAIICFVAAGSSKRKV
jgi:hypothetical protein